MLLVATGVCSAVRANANPSVSVLLPLVAWRCVLAADDINDLTVIAPAQSTAALQDPAIVSASAVSCTLRRALRELSRS
jgi:hypothetical protein